MPSQLLEPSDIDREHLRDYLFKHHDQTVGRYFERLIAYWIGTLCGFEIVAHGQQVLEGQRTAGEIDLLFHDATGRLNHWELACKFYLRFDSGEPTTQYIGPNSRDTLQKKARRLFEHQLPLGLRYAPDIEVQEAFVKGRIFTHWQSAESPSPNDANDPLLAVNHLKGKWLWTRELAECLHVHRHSTGTSRFRILQKPFWLSEEIAQALEPDILSVHETEQTIEHHFHCNGKPVLISGFSGDPTNVVEIDRWFIVPDHWPRQLK